MTDTISVQYIDECTAEVSCDNRGVARELSQFFTFEVPGAKFMPAFKSGMWDGNYVLYNVNTRRLYRGLIPYVAKFCKDRGYHFVDDNFIGNDNISKHEVNEFIKTLDLPFDVRDYQIDAVVDALRHRRRVITSPTGSGKSLIAYLIAAWYNEKLSSKKATLIIVPTTGLIHQLENDFSEYRSKIPAQKIYAGQDKAISDPIVISTWQSIYKMPQKWFDQFDVVIGDECHLFKAKSLMSIMEKLSDCRYRFGMTGSLDGTKVHSLVLEGLFGRINAVTTTKQLIDQKHLSSLSIKIIVLNHSPSTKKQLNDLRTIRKMKHAELYNKELEMIIGNTSRNNFITNLALSLEGNTLILFSRVATHGDILHDMISSKAKCPVHFIHGGVGGEVRDAVRTDIDKSDHSISVCSFGTFSTGVNIRRLNNLILASPTKSKVRVLQSIGRTLRRTEDKTSAVLFDIADDITYNGRKNATLEHVFERVSYYDQQQFPYKTYKVKLNG